MPLDANKEQEERTQRAQFGLKQRTITVEPDGDGWKVCNGDGGTYRAWRDAAEWRCTCLDFENTCARYGIRCKHIEAVRMWLIASTEHEHDERKKTMDMKELAAALVAPFAADRVSWKPQTVTKDKKRALAVAYIDARDVAERLDDVVGPLSWQVDHKQVDGQIVTGLALRDPETQEWVWKWDSGFVGGADSESQDDQMKARKGTMSDGLKRAAVLWGIGRYLYRLPKIWVDFDAEHRKLASIPALPEWALPASARKPTSAKAKQAVQRLSQPEGNPQGILGSSGSQLSATAAPSGDNGKASVPAASNGSDEGKAVASAASAPQPSKPNGNGSKALEEARAVICPVSPKEHPEYKGKTLGELMTLSPKFVDWLATGMSSNGDPARSAAKRAATILVSAVTPATG